MGRRGGVSTLKRVDAPFEKLALSWIACKPERRLEVFARGVRLPAAKLKLAECSWVERIRVQAIAILDRLNFFKPARGTFILRDCDGAVERDNRGWVYSH